MARTPAPRVVVEPDRPHRVVNPVTESSIGLALASPGPVMRVDASRREAPRPAASVGGCSRVVKVRPSRVTTTRSIHRRARRAPTRRERRARRLVREHRAADCILRGPARPPAPGGPVPTSSNQIPGSIIPRDERSSTPTSTAYRPDLREESASRRQPRCPGRATSGVCAGLGEKVAGTPGEDTQFHR